MRQIPLDATQPPLPEKIRNDGVQGFHPLNAHSVFEYSGLSTQLALYHMSTSKQVLWSAMESLLEVTDAHLHPLKETDFINLVMRRGDPSDKRALTRLDFSAAFDPISEMSTAGPTLTAMLHASDFDRTFQVIVEDLAPYVRAIVRCDERLAEERRILEDLLETDGRWGKRMRTTRASRSALEGGERRNMRREHWFDAHLDHHLIFRTGSDDWSRAAVDQGFP